MSKKPPKQTKQAHATASRLTLALNLRSLLNPPPVAGGTDLKKPPLKSAKRPLKSLGLMVIPPGFETGPYDAAIPAPSRTGIAMSKDKSGKPKSKSEPEEQAAPKASRRKQGLAFRDDAAARPSERSRISSPQVVPRADPNASGEATLDVADLGKATIRGPALVVARTVERVMLFGLIGYLAWLAAGTAEAYMQAPRAAEMGGAAREVTSAPRPSP